MVSLVSCFRHQRYIKSFSVLLYFQSFWFLNKQKCFSTLYCIQEFKEVAETLIQNGDIQRKVTIAAKEQIQKEHLPETEREAYLKIINNVNQWLLRCDMVHVSGCVDFLVSDIA